MRRVEEFLYAVDETEHFWIPLSDGTRLAARRWNPRVAHPVPAVVEYIPYGKRWGTRHRDEPMHRYFAGHGYAAIRIDIRGSGDSEGVLEDEYTAQEQHDGAEALRWIAEQPWCTGRIGMIGKSWGGFSALQIAALEPPELCAVIAVCASDDRYTDDAHYMGGCLLTENLIWGSVLFTLAAQPPDPALVEDWRAQWTTRLEHLPLYAERWLRHPARDDYWRHGSIAELYDRIRCPVFAVSGWADGYSNAVPRLLAGLRGPRRGLVGPWAHVYPHEGVPGPAIGFLQEALRWFDAWLRDEDPRGALEPMYRVWMQAYDDPASPRPVRPGRWVAEQTWPSERIAARSWELLADDVTLRTSLAVGRRAGAWCGFGIEGDLPGDQRDDDEASVCFDTAITERFEILGAPVLRIRVASDRPVGQIVVRLNDVAADGASLRVSYGVLNLAHRDTFEAASPLEPNVVYDVAVRLNDCAHTFEAGHTLRVATSTSYWPIVRPEAAPFTLTLSSAVLELPVRPPSPLDDALADFGPPEAASGIEHDDLESSSMRRTYRREGDTHVQHSLVDVNDAGGPALSRLDAIDVDIGHGIVEELRIREGDPESATFDVVQQTITRRGAWVAKVRTTHRMTGDVDGYVLQAAVEAWEGESSIFERTWQVRIAR